MTYIHVQASSYTFRITIGKNIDAGGHTTLEDIRRCLLFNGFSLRAAPPRKFSSRGPGRGPFSQIVVSRKI